MTVRGKWLYPLIGIAALLIINALDGLSLILLIPLLIWLMVALFQARRRAVAVAVVTALVVTGGGAAWLVTHPQSVAAYFTQRLHRRAAAAASGPGWTETRVPHFVVRYQEADSGAPAAVAALPEAYRQVADRFGDLPGESLVVIFPDAPTMESAMKMDFPDTCSASWIGDFMIVHSPATWPEACRAMTDVAQIVTHELTHAAAGHLAGSQVPKWLTEGLATYVAGQFTPESAARVAEMAKKNELYSLAEIKAAFTAPTDSGGKNRGLAYAQSASLVAYIEKTYGADRVKGILEAMGDGKSEAAAVKAVLGVSLDDLATAWAESVRNG